MTEQFDVTGLRAVVTGGAGDIGRCLVAGLLGGGAKVLAVDRDADALRDAMDGWACDRVASALCDITDEAAVDRLFADDVADGLGGIDLLVNNAGIMVRAQRPTRPSTSAGGR